MLQRGKLKIFFGMAGVGKTYAMLDAAHLRQAEGIDVVIGYLEPHPRPETAALAEALEKIPLRNQNFDLDAALARHPQLILVDQLAHTNPPGARHAKRCQDVEELLSAGINVYTTLDVQHLDSLNDIVVQITGEEVCETVPDLLLEKANEVELIDLPPDELLKRFEEGKVRRSDQSQETMRHFFRPGNLMALRELALRRTAERVDVQMQAYKQAHAIPGIWLAGERLLVCVSPSPLSRRLVRATKRMATSLHAQWLAVFVETPASATMSTEARNRVAETLRLAEQLGGEAVTLSGERVSNEIIAFARSRNVTKIIVGKPIHPFWRDVLHGSVLNDVVRQSDEIDVYVISGDEEISRPGRPAYVMPRPTSSQQAYAQAIAIVLAITLLGEVASAYISSINLIMVYLVGVVYVAMRCGRGPSLVASLLSVLAYDFWFIRPVLSFTIEDTEHLLTLGMMLLVALTISGITTRTRKQAEIASRRERRTASLYAMSREFAHNMGTDNLVRIAAEHISQIFDSQVVILLPDANGELIIHATENFTSAQNIHEQGVAQWVYEHRQAAGLGTDTLPAARGLYLPLVTSQGVTGVLGVYPQDQQQFAIPDQQHLLETFANQTALAIERTRLAAEAESQRTEIEMERLRNALLSSISHDLRTPLASITGAASSLLQNQGELNSSHKRELQQIIYEEAERLNRLVGNLLDMTRLESGGVHIEKEWQLLEEVIGTTLNRLKRQMKKHHMVKRLPPDLPLIPMDSVLVEQVLVNLIENAIKYSPAEAEIELSAVACPDEVEITVADRGAGIPAGMESRIFDKFYRAAPDHISGAGLGLAICRGIITAHGGRIWAAPRPGGGTIFRFTLPLEGEPPRVMIDDQ